MEKRDLKEYKNTSIWKGEEEDIIYWNYAPNTVMDIEVVTELVENRLQYTQGKNVYSLVDVTNVKFITKEAREFMSHPETGLKGILGGAFLSNNTVTTMMLNFFLFINKPIVPAKFFTNEQEALTWLIKLKKENLGLPAVKNTIKS